MNITMVAMVNSTSPQSQLNDSSEGLPVDSFGGLSKAPKSLPAKVSNIRYKFVLFFLLFVCLDIYFSRVCMFKNFNVENSDLKASKRSKEAF